MENNKKKKKIRDDGITVLSGSQGATRGKEGHVDGSRRPTRLIVRW